MLINSFKTHGGTNILNHINFLHIPTHAFGIKQDLESVIYICLPDQRRQSAYFEF